MGGRPLSAPPEPTAAGEPVLKPGFAEEALPQLEAVRRYASSLFAGRDAEADDLVQDVFLQAYRAWDGYTPGTNCRAWLFTICRNRFLRELERRGRRPELLTPDTEPDVEALAATASYSAIEAADPERRFFDSFVDAEVTAAIARLPDAFREAVVLSDVEGLSYAEISDVLGLPLGTVKSRLFRGRRLLQEALYDYAVEMGYIGPKERP